MTANNQKVNEDLKEKLKAIPALPGIYQFKDKNGKVIYVGKGKNLRNRVRSYFQSNAKSPKTLALIKRVRDFQLIVTDSEVEALVLENNLIKELKPRYNINLKDDKTFPYIRVTNEPYPQIYSTRQVVQDGSKYFGPYTNVRDMKISLRMINQTFRIRSCKYYIDEDSIEKGKVKVCLDYHINKCDGPCEGLISEKEYRKMVDRVIQVLRGKTDDLISELKIEMQDHSKKLDFEKAAQARDMLDKLSVYASKQKIISTDFGDRDIISAAVGGKDVACTILNIRNGRLIGQKRLKLSAEPESEMNYVISAIIRFYYNEFVEIPKEIVLAVCEETALPASRVFGVATFYSQFSLQPQGKNLVRCCKGTACHVRGAPRLVEELERVLEIKAGGTTPDKAFSLETVNCVGTCGMAPVVLVDDKYHPNIKPHLAKKLVARDEEGEE